jgi:hypothetical protein
MSARLSFPASSIASSAVLLASFHLACGVAHAQFDQDVPALTRKLDDATNHFAEAKQRAKTAASAGFDKMIGLVKNSKIPATVKADKISELTKAKKEFESNGVFPSDAEFVNVQLKYYLEINKSYRPLSKLHDQLMDAALKSNDEKQQAKLQERRKSLDAQLPGVGALTPGSQWSGTLALNGGNNVRYHLRVDRVTGSVFRAQATDNPSVANHPEYQVEGSVDGLAVKFRLAKVVQGGTVAAAFNGILTGDRMIGTFDQANAKGKHYPGVITLNLGR